MIEVCSYVSVRHYFTYFPFSFAPFASPPLNWSFVVLDRDQHAGADAVFLQIQPSRVECDQCRPVADADDGGAGQPFLQQAVEYFLRDLVQRGGRLVEE